MTTILAENLGSKLGGVVAGIPSTTVIALFFIGWTQGTIHASESVSIIPIILSINALLVVIYSFFLRYHFYIAYSLSILFWFVSSAILIFFNFNNLYISIASFLVILPMSYLILEYLLRIPSVSGKKYKFSYQDILIRGLIGGSTIAISVLFSEFGGPLLGGAFASFPAVFFATMAITYKLQGEKFSLGVMKSLMLSGLINVLVYSLTVRFFYISTGLLWGTIISFAISLLSAYFIYKFVKTLS